MNLHSGRWRRKQPVSSRVERASANFDQELFECAFDHAAIGKALVSLDGGWMRVNDALCRALGYTREELLATDFQSITHPEDLGSDLLLLERLLAGAMDSYHLEKRYVHKDGSTVWGVVSVSLVRTALGAPRFFVSEIQDVTRRQRAESEIEHFFEASPDLLAIAGTNGHLESVNAAWQRTLGWTRTELTARPFIDFVHPDDVERTEREAEAAYAGRPSPSFRNRWRDKAGAYHWFEWNTRRDADGRFYCVVRDVTERERAEQQRRWLASLVNGAQDAIVGLDPSARILSWNAGAEGLLGYTADEMIGQSVERLIPPHLLPEFEQVRASAAAGARVMKLDTLRLHRDGSLVDVNVVLSRVDDDLGRPLGWVSCARDIRESKRLSAALAERMELYATIARTLPGGSVCVFDHELRIVMADGPELLSQLGTSRADLEGKYFLDVTTPENVPAMRQAALAALAGTSSELEVRRMNRTLLIRFAAARDPFGAVKLGVALTFDVTELRRKSLLMQAIMQNVPNSAVGIFDRELRWALLGGPKLEHWLGQSAEQARGGEVARFVDEAELSSFAAALAGETRVTELRRGNHVFEQRTLPIADKHGNVVAGLSLAYDVTRHIAEAEELRNARLLLDTAIAGIADGVALLDPSRRILIANRAYAELFGFARDRLVDVGPEEFLAQAAPQCDDPEQFRAWFDDPSSHEPGAVAEFLFREPQRRYLRRTVKLAGTPEAKLRLVIWQDTTAQRDLIAEHEREGQTDALTGISNRRGAERALARSLERAERNGTPTSIALIDVDHFKRINDSFGHPRGDEVLRRIAALVASEARESDVVARWGGEEFIIVLACDGSGAARCCDRIRMAVSALVWDDLERVTVSAGVTQFQAGDSAGTLVARADELLYTAKREGRDRVISDARPTTSES